MVHSNGSLIKHPDMLRAVSTGQVNIAEFLLGQFGNEDPVFAADNIPFVATGYDNAYKFYQAQKPLLEKKLAGRGLRLLYSVAWPGQGIYTKNVLKSVDDLKGTKFRTYSPQTARLAELLGASPTVIQVPEVPQAFATGTVHAMITSSATGTSTKAWEFVKNYYLTNAFHPKNVVVVNERAFQRLPNAKEGAARFRRGSGKTRLGSFAAARADRQQAARRQRHERARARRRNESGFRRKSATPCSPSGRNPPAPTAKPSSKPTAANNVPWSARAFPVRPALRARRYDLERRTGRGLRTAASASPRSAR